MTDHAQRQEGADCALARRTFLAAAAAAGAGVALAGIAPGTTEATEPASAGGCRESIQDLLNLGLTIELAVTMGTKEATVIVFNCISTSIYDFVDPQVLKTLSDVHVYDGATNAEPRQNPTIMSIAP